MKRIIITLIVGLFITSQNIFADININTKGDKKIIQAEYFFSNDPTNPLNDPGLGKATPLEINNNIVSADIDTSNLSIGKHYLIVRLKDSDGDWGPARQHKIEIQETAAIKGAEYFIGKDPGKGYATPLTLNVDGSFGGILETSNMAYGNYTVSARITDSLTRWGQIQNVKFEVREHQYPTITGNITTFVAGWNSLPVRNADVSLKDTGYATKTDSKGNFELLDIPVGEYTLIVDSEGLIPISKQFKWNGSQNLYLKEITIPITIFDPDKNGRVGLEEAINALQVVAGIKTIDYSNLPEIPDEKVEVPSATCKTTKYVHCGETIVLDGSDSFDSYYYNSISYNWKLIDGVNGTFFSGQNSKIAMFKSDPDKCEVGQTSTFKLTVTNQWGIEDTAECQVSYQSKLIEIKRYKFQDNINNTFDFWTTTESEPVTYIYESSLGYALENPIEGKTIPIFACEAKYYTKVDKYLSKDRCDPQYCADFAEWKRLQEEPIFYLYKNAGANRSLIRSCWTPDTEIRDTFASKALSCDEDVPNSGDVGDLRSPLGYAVKQY